MQQKEKVSEVVCPLCNRSGLMNVLNEHVLQCTRCFKTVDADPEIRARARRFEEVNAAKRALLRAAEEENTKRSRILRTRRV